MEYYVAIEKLNGRVDYFKLAKTLNDNGYSDRVEYNAGGWADYEIAGVKPHLKFSNKDDALAFLLTHGGKLRSSLPLYDILGEHNAL